LSALFALLVSFLNQLFQPVLRCSARQRAGAARHLSGGLLTTPALSPEFFEGLRGLHPYAQARVYRGLGTFMRENPAARERLRRLERRLRLVFVEQERSKRQNKNSHAARAKRFRARRRCRARRFRRRSASCRSARARTDTGGDGDAPRGPSCHGARTRSALILDHLLSRSPGRLTSAGQPPAAGFEPTTGFDLEGCEPREAREGRLSAAGGLGGERAKPARRRSLLCGSRAEPWGEGRGKAPASSSLFSALCRSAKRGRARSQGGVPRRARAQRGLFTATPEGRST
jgi:hypothetical protein